MIRRYAQLAVAAFVATVAACVIGPKQDDPLRPPESNVSDSGTSGGGDSGALTDEVGDPTATPEAGGAGDAVADTQVFDAPSDASSDACPDGGVPLTATGPWNTEKACWKGTRVFECVAGIDGGAAETCFVEIATGDLYRAGSTHIPSGTNYRVCTEEERARVASGDICK